MNKLKDLIALIAVGPEMRAKMLSTPNFKKAKVAKEAGKSSH